VDRRRGAREAIDGPAEHPEEDGPMTFWRRLRERWAVWDCPAVFVFLFLVTGGLLAWSLLTLPVAP
jgi:hypothetical protein